MENYSLPVGFQLRDKYCIQKLLGQGGFGITYMAEDTVLETSVCIKELFISGNSTRSANNSVMSTGSKEFSFDDFKQRFIQEARQLAKFRHPSIVRVLDFFETNNTAYVVMEYIEGKTLKEFTLEHGFVNQDLAIPIISQLLDAVEEVHNMGMLHRDIKPENILLTPRNSICLIDFGSAREFSEGMTMTQTAMLTPGYAPMEQYSNRSKRGTFTDIYALGATMYFMLTGEKPLAATDRFAEEMTAPHQLNSAISSQISSAVMLAMQMKPEERFQNIADFRSALQQLSALDYKNTQKQVLEETDYLSTIKLASTFTNEFGMEFILVEAGTFMMGALSNDSSAFEDEKPLHEVKIEKSFYLSKYPLTQNQWLTIMGTNPSWFTGCGTCPVENISFLDVQRFISILKQRSAKVYRLPTEEEWEYAAKGGKQSSNYKFAGSNIIEEVAWFEGKSNRKTNPVGAKKSNELGFHDMSGNVMEWCDTIYKSYSRTKNESKNHEEISVVIRGGSWNNHPIACRVTNRFNRPPDYKQNTLGFRLVLEV